MGVAAVLRRFHPAAQHSGGITRQTEAFGSILAPIRHMPITIRQSTQREESVPGGRRLTLEFRAEGDAVPALLLLPTTAVSAPAALLLHGYGSRKEHMAEGVGRALLARGIASLAIDLPLHGTRQDPLQAQAARNPLAIARLWRSAIGDAMLAIGYLRARRDVNRQCIALVGYSMGAFLGTIITAREPAVRATILAAGGDLPSGTPFESLVRRMVDPLKAVRQFAGRPLLMVHGRRDSTIRPEQAERLFAAAGEPKELRWWDAGHILPPAAIDDAADWLAGQIGTGARAETG